MALRNFEVRKVGEGYILSEQSGSNYHTETATHEAPDREDAANWLRSQGGAPDLVDQALEDAGSTERVFFQMVGNYSNSEDFPKL